MEEKTIARLVICLRDRMKCYISQMIKCRDAEEKPNPNYWGYLKGVLSGISQAISEIRDSYGAPLGEVIREYENR